MEEGAGHERHDEAHEHQRAHVALAVDIAEVGRDALDLRLLRVGPNGVADGGGREDADKGRQQQRLQRNGAQHAHRARARLAVLSPAHAAARERVGGRRVRVGGAAVWRAGGCWGGGREARG